MNPSKSLPTETLEKTNVGNSDVSSDQRDLVEFVKMQALGNDFILLNEESLLQSPSWQTLVNRSGAPMEELARTLCNRHLGIGADGLIVVSPSKRPDCELGWSYFNSDGSSADICGNGLRCLALWAVDNSLVQGSSFAVETATGPVPVVFEDADSITITLGKPRLDSRSIPVSGPARENVVQERLVVDGKSFVATCLSVGNPHCVIFDAGLSQSECQYWAPKIQALSHFPEGVNVEIVEVESPEEAEVFVWERGAGPTLACASGAAAVLVAGVLEGRLKREALIHLPGGSLKVSWLGKESKVQLTGPSRQSFTGKINLGAALLQGKHF